MNAAKSAALAAGHFLGTNRNIDIQTGAVQDRDVKLKADEQSEAIILNSLSSMAPYPVLAEEGGEYGDLSQDSFMWIVDPLDGTVNYSRGINLCCVSIALYQGWKPILGVVYDF